MANHTGRGCFKKGESGNPGGRPRLPAEVKEAFQAKAPQALAVLVRCLESSDDRIAMMAAQAILDRGYGKPHQTHQFDMEERIKLIAVVPRKASSTEEWLKLVGEQKVIEHQPTDLDGTSREHRSNAPNATE